MDFHNYVYILQCSDDTLYTGWTNNLEKRIEAHNQGKGAKYTKPRLPVKLIYTEAYATQHEAMVREFDIKKLSRQEKLALIVKRKSEGKIHEPNAH